MRSRADLVVAVGIVIVVVGLLVAGIARLQDAGRAAECRNNLRQHAIALFSYHDQQGHFPAATMSNEYPAKPMGWFPAATMPNEYLAPEKRLSWQVAVCDYYEQRIVYLDRTKAWDHEVNIVPRAGGVDGGEPHPIGNCAWYLCPGNRYREPDDRPGATHYVGIAGLGMDAAKRSLGHPDAGVFGYDRTITAKDIRDGTSTTLMVVETANANGPWTAGGFPTVRGLDPNGLPYLGKGGQFGGTHRGKVAVLFADGTAQMLSESMSPQIFEALVTIAGGEDVARPSDH